MARLVFSDSVSDSRKSKIVDLKDIGGNTLILDGYNIIITVESILKDKPIILADDGFLRDFQAIFGKYKFNKHSPQALTLIFKHISNYKPKYVKFYLDRPVSFSGRLAKEIEEMMENYGLNGEVILSNNVDYDFVQECNKDICIAATSDGIIIDNVEKVVDIPHLILKQIKVNK